jgi:putative transposase
MVFKFVVAASRSWRRLQGEKQVPQVIRRILFRDGIEGAEATPSSAD